MRLYYMTKGKQPVLSKRKVSGVKPHKGSGAILLAPHHGAGIRVEAPVPRPVNMDAAKQILGGLNVVSRKKRYISI